MAADIGDRVEEEGDRLIGGAAFGLDEAGDGLAVGGERGESVDGVRGDAGDATREDAADDVFGFGGGENGQRSLLGGWGREAGRTVFVDRTIAAG
ncbi:MAG: hypothetical protein BZY69_01115 [SAR202 cluster bacterium Casp-Chloro-G1]|nr:MAG: hypothetical protein BZY69_01115 [SAR202 cluster bacterium Casp-Chloro-G1]